MIIVVKIITILFLLLICIQDLRTREVWNYHFVIYGLGGALLFYTNSYIHFFWLSILINLLVVAILVLAQFLMAKFIFKKKLLTQVLGLGDILFYIAFAISFPTISFLNFLIFSTAFAFVLHLVLKNNSVFQKKTVPLAGSMSLFLAVIYVVHWAGFYELIYL